MAIDFEVQHELKKQVQEHMVEQQQHPKRVIDDFADYITGVEKTLTGRGLHFENALDNAIPVLKEMHKIYETWTRNPLDNDRDDESKMFKYGAESFVQIMKQNKKIKVHDFSEQLDTIISQEEARQVLSIRDIREDASRMLLQGDSLETVADYVNSVRASEFARSEESWNDLSGFDSDARTTSRSTEVEESREDVSRDNRSAGGR